MKDVDGAIGDLTEVANMAPTLPQAFCNRSSFYLAKGLPEKAVADCDRAIALDSGCAEAYGSRGLARLLVGQEDLAKKDFENCLKLRPELRTTLDADIEKVLRAKANHPK